jgi:hypothetical protein
VATTISPPCKPPVNSTPSADQPERKPQAQPPFWSLKPWWCQPWSIISTGVLMVGGSWVLLHRLWISFPLSLGVLAWWLLFLVLVPAAYRSAGDQA